MTSGDLNMFACVVSTLEIIFFKVKVFTWKLWRPFAKSISVFMPLTIIYPNRSAICWAQLSPNQHFLKGNFSLLGKQPFSIKVWQKLSVTTATQTEWPRTTREPRTGLILFINLRNGRVCTKVWRKKGWRVGRWYVFFFPPQSFLWP